MSDIINKHFYWLDKKMHSNCTYGCCMHCKYLTDGKDDNNIWLACSESCLTDKKIIGKISCNDCIYNTFGKKLL